MVVHTRAFHLPESPSETVSAEKCSPCSEETTSTLSPSLRGKSRRRSLRRPLGKVEMLFLFITSIVLTYIYKCSTRPYIAFVYRDEAWIPNVTDNKKAKRRASHHHHHHRRHRDRHHKKNATNFGSHESSFPNDRTQFLPYPQVVFYGDKSFKASKGRRIRSRYDMRTLRKRRQKSRPSWSLPTNTTFCVPMKSWQTTSFPTCNRMHELSLSNQNEEQARLLGNGGWRATWKVSNGEETLAYKTLR